MAQVLNYISPLHFYFAEQQTPLAFTTFEQRDNKNDYSFGNVYSYVMLMTSLGLQVPPFLLHTDISYVAGQTPTFSLALFDKDNTGSQVVSNINASAINDNGLVTIYCNGLSDMFVSSVTEGIHYLRLVYFNGATSYYFYSELFYITDEVYNYVKMQWSNPVDLYINKRTIPFSTGWSPYVYVDSHIGKPDYSFDEESTDRMGYEFIESIVSKKEYQFTFIAPEYLCDAIRIMKLCYTKTITRYDRPNYGRSYTPMNIDFDIDWQEQGNLAAVTTKFSVDNIVSAISGFNPLEHGDFNNDYNNDFNNY